VFSTPRPYEEGFSGNCERTEAIKGASPIIRFEQRIQELHDQRRGRREGNGLVETWIASLLAMKGELLSSRSTAVLVRANWSIIGPFRCAFHAKIGRR
jgi:hypothetical protein